MDAISFETPRAFIPDPVHISILETVSEKQGCAIGHVVQQLLPHYGESSIRSAVRTLLSNGSLDGGKSPASITLRLTSKGRILLQKAAAVN